MNPMQRLRASSLAAVTTLSLLTGCSSLNPFASSGPKPAELVAIKSSADIKVLWQARIGDADGYAFQPALVGQTVYAAAHDGAVARFDGGQLIWRADAGHKLSAGVGSDERVTVVVTTSGEVVAFDAVSGEARWRKPLGAEVLAPPAVTGRTVVVRASDNRLIGLNAADGAQRWVYQRSTPPLALRSAAGLLVEDRAVIVGYPGGKLVAVNVDNGGPLWELTVATPRGVTELERIADIAGTAVLGRRDICAVAFQGRAACFDLSNGSAIWSRDFSSSVGMDRDARYVMITDDNDAVNALDAFNGASVWKQDAMVRRSLTRPLIVGDHVAVGDFEGYVHLLDRNTGEFAARLRTDGSAILADPKAFGTNGLLVQTQDGGIFALEAQ